MHHSRRGPAAPAAERNVRHCVMRTLYCILAVSFTNTVFAGTSAVEQQIQAVYGEPMKYEDTTLLYSDFSVRFAARREYGPPQIPSRSTQYVFQIISPNSGKVIHDFRFTTSASVRPILRSMGMGFGSAENATSPKCFSLRLSHLRKRRAKPLCTGQCRILRLSFGIKRAHLYETPAS